MISGMILAESLTDQSVIEGGQFKIEDRYPMLMDGVTPVEVVMVSVATSCLLPALVDISKALLPRRFYAHFVDGDLMYVVFPSTISVVEKSSKSDAVTCIEVGRKFDVPESQLPIERMFSFRHAEHD